MSATSTSGGSGNCEYLPVVPSYVEGDGDMTTTTVCANTLRSRSGINEAASYPKGYKVGMCLLPTTMRRSFRNILRTSSGASTFS